MSRAIKFRVYDLRTGKPQTVMLSTVEVGSKAGCFNGLPDNLVVCQYTGMNDKNGVEIYEGSIVGLIHKKHGVTNTMTVVWNEDIAGFDWEDTNEDSWPDSFTGFIDEYEVIGHIYEKPDLREAVNTK